MLNMLSKFMGLFSPSPSKRYQSRHHALSRLVKMFGFRIYHAHNTWFQDKEFLQVWSGSPFYDGHPENIEDFKFLLF